MSLGRDDSHHLLFMNGSTLEDQVEVKATGRAGGLAVLQLAVPEAAIRAGYDGIRIMPRGGDRIYSLGDLLLK